MALGDWFRLLLLSLLWGSSFFYIEIALQSSTPLTIVLFRVGAAGAALMLFCFARGISVKLPLRLLGGLSVLAILGNVLPFSLITAGQIEIPSGLAAILLAATPLFSVLVGRMWSDRAPIVPAKLCGVLIGMLGVAVLMGSDAMKGISGSVLGQIAILAASLSYALSAIYARRFRDMRPSVLSAWMLTLSALILGPFAFLLESPLNSVPAPAGLAALAALSLLCTALAYLIYFRVLASAGATNALLVTFIQPPVAILLGVLFLKEQFLPQHFAGMGLIFIGLALVDGRVVRLVAGRG